MAILTARQQEILSFLIDSQEKGGGTPTLREIALNFGFRSVSTVVQHIEAIKHKGFLKSEPGKARSFRPITPLNKFRRPIANIPLYGSIPAGSPQDKEQIAEGCISIDMGTLGIRNTQRTFALQVKGDSMIGKHIVEGDYVILEHGVSPKSGDVVAALIDNESTLKTFVFQNRKPFLKAENPRYPKLLPAQELVIQGVMVGLIRKPR